MHKNQPIATLRNHFRRQPRTVPAHRILYPRIPKQGRCNTAYQANRANRTNRANRASHPIR